MTEARRRRLTTLALVVAVLTAGLLGTVDATQQAEAEELTTGHSVFMDASTSFNSCFAGLAGALLQQVTWFNGQTLFSRMEGGSDKYIYVVEHLQDDNGDGSGGSDGYDDESHIEMGDPTDETLFRTNRTYTFTDKNDKDGHQWVTREYFALRDHKNVSTDTPNNDFGEADDKKKVYVFVVKVNDEAFLDETIKKQYNFAMVVDTCRFHNSGQQTNHSGHVGESGEPEAQHLNQSGMNESHEHGEFQVDIYVGGEPDGLAVNDQPQVPEERDDDSEWEDDDSGDSG